MRGGEAVSDWEAGNEAKCAVGGLDKAGVSFFGGDVVMGAVVLRNFSPAINVFGGRGADRLIFNWVGN